MDRIKTLLLFVSVFLAACNPLAFSGASEPTEHTFELTEADLAEAADTACEPGWATEDPEATVQAAFDRLALKSIRVVMRNPIAGGTAGQSTLYLRNDFDERSPESQAAVMVHEVGAHSCDRERLGDARFERRYKHSAGRWVLETRADVLQIRQFQRMGASEKFLRQWTEDQVGDMRDTYLLWDIDPEQFERETPRIILGAVGLQP